MSEWVSAVRWELFKLAKLRLSGVLLVLLLAVVLLHAGLSYRAYRDVVQYVGQTVREAPAPLRQQRAMQQELLARVLRANLVLPSALGGVSGVLYFPGLVFVSAAAAWLVGAEFSWGTLHRQLARGRSRGVVVASKLALVAVMAAVAVVAGLAVGGAAGVWTSQLLGSWRREALAGAVWWDLGVVALRLWATLVTYGTAATAFAFVFRSAGLATAGVLIFYLLDVLVASLIVQSHGWLTAVRPYLLSSVTRALVVEHNPFGTGFVNSLRAAVDTSRVLSVAGAWAVLGVWAAAFVVVSLASFLRRDLPA